MKNIIVLAAALSIATSSHAGQSTSSLAERNANTVVKAIQTGIDLPESPLANVADETTLAELALLKNCSADVAGEVTPYLVIHHWVCKDGVAHPKNAVTYRRTTSMRFGSDGKLFALAVNPSKIDLKPTAEGLALTDVPSRGKLAKRFGEAAVSGSDITLVGLIPLEPYQLVQLQDMVGGEFMIIEPMSGRRLRDARKILGPRAKIYQRPHDGIDLNLSNGPQALSVTLFFDENDLPIGVHIEKSLLRVTKT